MTFFRLVLRGVYLRLPEQLQRELVVHLDLTQVEGQRPHVEKIPLADQNLVGKTCLSNEVREVSVTLAQ